MESTGGSRPGLCVRCAESTHPWSDPHTDGPIRTLESLRAAPLRRLTTACSGALLPSPDRGPGKVPEPTWLLALRCAKIRYLGARQHIDAAYQIGICPSDPEQTQRGWSGLMEHRQDHPGNRPPGPHPSEEIPPSEVLAQRRAF